MARQVKQSGSDPCDSLGGISKQSQQAHGHEEHPGFKRGEKTFNPREPEPAGDYACTRKPADYNRKAAPSSGGRVPAHKDLNEGQGSNYHKGTHEVIPGDGKITERTVMDKPDVRRVQANQNNDVSSRKKSTWGN